MVVTRTKSRNKARSGVKVLRGRGQNNLTEAVSVKPIPPKMNVVLRPVQPILHVKKKRLEHPIDIKKPLTSDRIILDMSSRRKDENHGNVVPLHKRDGPITCVSSPPRLRLKGKRRHTRQITSWSPGPLPTSKERRHLAELATKELQYMLNLRIPTLPSGSDLSQFECLQYLNWEINASFPPDNLKPSVRHRDDDPLPRSTDAAQTESNVESAEPETPLSQSIGEDLEKERLRIRHRLRHGSFQIISNWTPIRGIESFESLGVREGTVDSSPQDKGSPFLTEVDGIYHVITTETFPEMPPRQLRQSASDPLIGGRSALLTEERRMNDSPRDSSISAESPHADAVSDLESSNSVNTESPGPPPYEETNITVATAGQIRIPLMNDWEMMVVMEPSPFNWTYMKPQDLPFREQSRHLKPFPPNYSSPISDINSSSAAARFMSLHTKDMPNNQECGLGHVIGRLFADLISSDLISASCLLRRDALPAWRASIEPVILDVGCVPTQGALAWDERVAPLLLAAQFSEGVGSHDRKASQQLACGFHSTLIILILYYLDTRSRLGAKGASTNIIRFSDQVKLVPMAGGGPLLRGLYGLKMSLTDLRRIEASRWPPCSESVGILNSSSKIWRIGMDTNGQFSHAFWNKSEYDVNLSAWLWTREFRNGGGP